MTWEELEEKHAKEWQEFTEENKKKHEEFKAMYWIGFSNPHAISLNAQNSIENAYQIWKENESIKMKKLKAAQKKETTNWKKLNSSELSK